MAKIIVVRHAESVANTKGIYQGQTYNTDLSSLGKKQALALAKRLSNEGISLVITSPLKRAMQTARPVVELTGARVQIERTVIETNHGVWEGKTKFWIEENYPHIYESWLNYPGETHFPGGEHFIDTVTRIEKYIYRGTWRGTSVIVTHDNVVRAIVCLAKKIPVNNLWTFNLEPAAITEFDIRGVNGKKELNVLRINDTKHLNGCRADVSVHAL